MPSIQRAEEGLPGNAPETDHEETDNDDAIFNGILARKPGNLAVTSSLHPFWHTRKGGVVIGLVVLTVIGAIVGGAIGGAKAHADLKTQSTSSPASTTSPSQVSNGCSPSVTGTTTF